MTATLRMMDRLSKEELESFDVHIFQDSLSISLWIMEYLSNEKTSFGSTEIARYAVDVLGISMSKQSVQAALTNAAKNKLCHKGKNGFKLMRMGQEELLKRMNRDRVVLLEPGKPFSAGIELGNVFSQISGKEMRINDPYVDEKTLDIIYRYFLDKGVSIKILTSKVKSEERFKNSLEKMKIEEINIEVHKTDMGIIHDRYFMDDKHFWLCGNSLNNLGKKESFIVMLNDNGIHQNMLKTFDSRWQSSTPV